MDTYYLNYSFLEHLGIVEFYKIFIISLCNAANTFFVSLLIKKYQKEVDFKIDINNVKFLTFFAFTVGVIPYFISLIIYLLAKGLSVDLDIFILTLVSACFNLGHFFVKILKPK